VKLIPFTATLGLVLLARPALTQQQEIPKSIAESVGEVMQFAQGQFLSVAEAMPAEKYSFIPTSGNFKDARSFAEQIKHVACANYAFFNEIPRSRRSCARRADRRRPRRKPNCCGTSKSHSITAIRSY
jgi:hypothetical protein